MGGRGERRTDVTLHLSHHHIVPRLPMYNLNFFPWSLEES